MLDPEFDLITYQHDLIRVRVVRFGVRPPTHEQRVRGEWAAMMIRVGVRWRFPPMVVAAQRVHHALYGSGFPFEFREPDTKPETEAFFTQMIRDLELDFEVGRLIVIEGAMPLLGIPPVFELTPKKRPELQEPPPPPKPRIDPERLTLFEARFVDEVGQAIGGVEVEISAGAQVERLKTNPAGVALLDDVTSMSATITVLDTDALAEVVAPRWEKPRPGTPPGGMNTQRFALTGTPIGGIALKPAVPNTIVITPPLGQLFVELWDKSGRVRHAGQKYTITGPASFSGQTDDEGRLVHADVFPGDYELTLTLEIDPGDGQIITEQHQSPLVALAPGDGRPQLRNIGAVPVVSMARLRGMLFDTNKCFLLPTALDALGKIRDLYLANSPSELLIVGHTDTTGEPAVNDPLSKERADSVAAYLKDDVDAWLAFYDASGKKRWGSREDRLMISSMPDFGARDPEEDLVEWYQRTRELEVDGKAGPQTRRALVTEYLQLDGTSLGDESEFEISIATHGCGENFPLADTGLELDQQAADEREDPFDRRVELFFFDKEFGVLPLRPLPMVRST